MGITEMYIGLLVGNPERKGPLGKRRCLWEDIKMNLKETGWKGLVWNGIAQNRYRCRFVVNTVMIFGFHKMRGISLLAEELAGSQEGHCCMGLILNIHDRCT
jgi:hypothetical protein